MSAMHLRQMTLTFLGTASQSPSFHRGVSATGLQVGAQLWLFDAGETVQLAFHRVSLAPKKLRKIFITHLHGDHVFGLPSVLSMAAVSAMNRKASQPGDVARRKPIEIYGPAGLRSYLDAAEKFTSANFHPFIVHELHGIPLLGKKRQRSSRVKAAVPSGRVRGRNIFPDDDGIWRLCSGDNVSVAAAPLKHSVPCVGYAVEEDSIVGHLRADVVQPVVERNKAALNEMGYRHHMSIMSELKAIRPGETREFPDGTVLSYEDILHPPRKGRKVVILGDTCDSSRMQPLAADADAVVHECTIVPTPEETEREALAKAKDRFHSTPSMAGAFAKSVNAKKLFLNHFPQRCLPNNKALVAAIERQAAKSAGLNRGDVVATRDYLNVSIETNQSKENDAMQKNEE